MKLSSFRLHLARPPTGYVANTLLVLTALCAGLLLLVLSQGIVVMNGSNSLPHNGYLMLRWPNTPIKGSYVAFDGPGQYNTLFSGLVFVKKVFAVAGDELRVEEGQVCVEATCFPVGQGSASRGLTLNKATIVPEGRIAVFGTSPDSLDSRYAQIGFIRTRDLVGVGVPLPIPHWENLKLWMDRWL